MEKLWRNNGGLKFIFHEVDHIEMGLDWMLRSKCKKPVVSEKNEILIGEAPVEELEGTPSVYPLSNSFTKTPVKSAINGFQAPSNLGYTTQYSTDGFRDYDKLVIDYL
ncbi:uncharacterized protein LOC131601590 isoform X2 [Vicia villosa]|uniref:uncharacterized protein LOC131601590 isoform X2 n=1 Tax=Vicia villosa TaxID=3911 RepID=UPI00273B8447|nr:uncharacterized protein LOC131601590 isoform X2 [Vicia villosa]XP_058729430.1 uncharacterized protein LOC131601590 isoform X2 [Vicia villosa]XP_058729431.1 uncharacterized protein LOC131601590 isoform X2 [Vicia villosa]XP_058729432.1 uncharacterized protein LOC131601590 isoform X2 [Vicia villosa]